MKKLTFLYLTSLAVLGSSPCFHAEDKAPAAAVAASAKPDADVEKKASAWVAALNLNDSAKAARVEEVIATHLMAVRDWHNAHTGAGMPEGTNAVTGKPLTTLERQFLADSAMPKTAHEALMAGLRKDLTPDQVEAILDKYTIGKVAFTMNGYHSIVPDLTKPEEAQLRQFVRLDHTQKLIRRS